MEMNAHVHVRAKLEVRLFNKHGELIRDFGVVSEDAPVSTPSRKAEIVSYVLLLLAIAGLYHFGGLLTACLLIFGLVTNVGVNYEAAAFSNAGPPVSGLNFHDSGTGATPAAITDTALVSPAGGPRVNGTQSSSTNTYQTIGTISYGSVLVIAEWGLFSASSGGTLWDRRVFGPIVTDPGDKIEFTYTCLFASGGI